MYDYHGPHGPTPQAAAAAAAQRATDAAARRDAASRAVSGILAQARAAGRDYLTEAETVAVQQLRAERAQARRELGGDRSAAGQLQQIAAEEAAYRAASWQTSPVAFGVPQQRLPAYDRVARIGYEQRTYNPDTDRTGTGFLMDVLRSQIRGEPAAWERLSRHMAEERVERPLTQDQQRVAGDSNTGNWAGLVVPQYLTALYGPSVTARRPFADHCCTPHPLPDAGMAIDISRVTTGTSTALQSSELATVSGTSADDTLLTVPVQTAAGFQNVSRQAIDRGTGIEDVLLRDLMAHCGATLDSTLITQATTGLSAVAQATTYDDTSPTAAKMYPKILNCQANAEAATLGPPVTHAVMHSRRWAWLSSQLTNTWPLINMAGIPAQSGGQSDPNASYVSGVRGKLPNGLLVVVDNNLATNLGVGTNQDEIYVTTYDECHLFEAPNSPLYIRAEQPNATSLGILLVVWEYFGYFLTRITNAHSKLSGTSLVTPVF
jgi:hypothetical protein